MAQTSVFRVLGLRNALDTLDRHYGWYTNYSSEELEGGNQKTFRLKIYPDAERSYRHLLNSAGVMYEIDAPFVTLGSSRVNKIRLTSAETGEPLLLAWIRTGTEIIPLQLVAGYFRLPSGLYSFDSIHIYSPGFEVMKLSSKELYASKELSLHESGLLREFKQTALRDYQWLHSNRQMGSEQIVPNGNFMSLLGEHDPVQSLRMLPGIQGGGENVPGLIIRGNSPDQNLVLVDDVPLYKSNHLFGFTSVFSANAFKDAELFKNHIPAEYGGRVSGVLHFHMKEGNKFEHTQMLEMGFLSTQLGLSGPMKKGASSYALHLRRSNVDWLLSPLARPLIKDSPFTVNALNYIFYDAHLRLDLKTSERNDLFLTAYNGRDQGSYGFKNESNDFPSFTESSRRRFSWGNRQLAMHWKWQPLNPRFTLSSTVFHTAYGIRTGDVYDIEQESRDSNTYISSQQLLYRAGIADFGVKSRMRWQLAKGVLLKSGGQANVHRINRGASLIYNELNGIVLRDTQSGNSAELIPEFELHAAIEWKSANQRWNMNSGVLWSSFNNQYHNLLPRFRIQLKIDTFSWLHFSFNRQAQYLQSLPNRQTSIPINIWLPSTGSITPVLGEQWALGWNHEPLWGRIATEVFYRQFSGLYEYRPGSSFISTNDLEDGLAQGAGRSWGAECMAELRMKNWRFLFSYAYLNFQQKTTQINEGDWYSSVYDKPHDLKLNLLRKTRKNQMLSISWWYNSGGMVSLPTSRYWTDFLGSQVLRDHYSRVNNYRMPDYHRLDVSYSFHKDGKNADHTWQIGLYNVYNHLNPVFISLQNDAQQRIQAVPVGILPLLPVLYYEVHF